MEPENEHSVAVTDPEVDEGEDLEADLPEDTDWKAEATKARRSASRYKRQRDEARQPKAPAQAAEPKPQAAEPGSLDYAKKAYLASNGIKDADEVAFVQQALKESGKELDALIGAKWFQAELQEFRDNKAAKIGTPSSERRGESGTADTVDYWLAKGELPPVDKPELRRKVVAAKREQTKSGHFYNS